MGYYGIVMFFREISEDLKNKLSFNKIIVLLGPRQVGKTTLIKSIIPENQLLEFNFDLIEDRRIFTDSSKISVQHLISTMRNQSKTILFVDEIQKEPTAFDTVKYIFDNYKDIKIILSGSTALELQKGVFETLAGRAVFLKLLGLSPEEIYHQLNGFQEKHEDFKDELLLRGSKEILERSATYGTYPSVYFSDNPLSELESLANNISLRDLEILGKNREKFFHLVKLLALQIGSLISLEELSSLTELSKVTVYEYIDKLEQLFIIYRAEPLDLSKRKSISRGFKVYFWDLGLRNYFANDFMEFSQNPNNGCLFENFVINNFKKKNLYKNLKQEIGFFRNANQSEIDIVVKSDHDQISLYECKLGKSQNKIHSRLLDKEIDCINKNNWISFI